MKKSDTVLKVPKGFLWVILLVALMCICYAVTASAIFRQATESCYYDLDVATEQLAVTLLHHMDMIQENLAIIATALSEVLTAYPEELERALDDFSGTRHIDALCVQLPDGTLISGGNPEPDFSALPDYSSTMASLPVISNRFPSQLDENEWFLYHALPILRDGQMIAILYGFMDLAAMPDCLSADVPYRGESQLYLVDGDTGDFLMDTWHPKLANLYDESMQGREIKPGYDIEEAYADIQHGRSGYLVFVSRTAGEYFYTCYQPVGINNWSIQITVQESQAFARVREITRMIYVLGAVIGVIVCAFLIGYILWHRRSLRKEQQQTGLISYVYEVQSILFDAYHNPARMTDALRKVAEAMDAEGAQLLVLQDRLVSDTVAWHEATSAILEAVPGEDLKRVFPSAFRLLSSNRNLYFFEGNNPAGLSEEEMENFRTRNIRSMMLSPVVDANGVLRGGLCAVNFQSPREDCRVLESVSRSFMMAMQNRESYEILHNMGTIDALTGLKNRNSYEAALDGYARHGFDPLHCIYIDVNGLHEVNNQQGHQAGDAMLQKIAEIIQSIFGADHAYRTGGDEFIVFFMAQTCAAVEERIAAMQRRVTEHGYHISAGLASQSGDSLNVQLLVSTAEERMYQAKKAFYEKNDRRSRMRE